MTSVSHHTSSTSWKARVRSMPVIGKLATWLYSLSQLNAMRMQLIEICAMQEEICAMQEDIDRQLYRLDPLNVISRLNRLDALEISNRLNAFDTINIANRLTALEAHDVEARLRRLENAMGLVQDGQIGQGSTSARGDTRGSEG